MGYIKHHTIVVTGWREKDLDEARKKAVKIFEETCKDNMVKAPYGSNIISPIVSGLTNGQKSFFIAPDGSKEGWNTSNNCNDARTAFLDWLKSSDNYCDYIEVVFGGDDEQQTILRSKESDLDEY